MSKYISNPDQNRVRELFEYLPSGQLKRKSLNKITGTKPTSAGYAYTKIDDFTVPVHRLVYIYHRGRIPDGYHIDHINHDRFDNRIENLQAIPARENLGKHKRSSEYDGVYKAKDYQRYYTRIKIDLGVYDTEEESIKAIEEFMKVVDKFKKKMNIPVDNSV
jgi:uncharacterized protein (UPF0248 family)